MIFTTFYIDRIARQWIFASVCLLVVLLLTPAGISFLHLPDFSFRPYMHVASVLMLVYFAHPVYMMAVHEIRTQSYGQHVLYGLAFFVAGALVMVDMAMQIPDSAFYASLGVVAWLCLTGYLAAVVCYPDYIQRQHSQYEIVPGTSSTTRVVTVMVMTVSIATVVVWSYVFGASIRVSILAGLAVLVCVPVSLYQYVLDALAKTLHKMLTERGWTLRSIQSFISLHGVKTVLLDSSGFPVAHELRVTKVVLLPHPPGSEFSEHGQMKLIQYAHALETTNTHPVAQALDSYVRTHNISPVSASAISNRSEKGVEGLIGSVAYVFGSKDYVQGQGVWSEDAARLYTQAIQEGYVPVFLADVTVIGALFFTKYALNELKETIGWLRRNSFSLSVTVERSSPDRELIASLVRENETIEYETPEELVRKVKHIIHNGSTLIAGTPRTPPSVYIQGGLNMMIRSDIHARDTHIDIASSEDSYVAVKAALLLSQRVHSYIRVIRVVTLGYIIVMIPVAAGAFIPSGIQVSFAYAAVAQVCFSASVWVLLHILQRSMYNEASLRYGTR